MANTTPSSTSFNDSLAVGTRAPTNTPNDNVTSNNEKGGDDVAVDSEIFHEKLAALSFNNTGAELSRDVKLRIHALKKLQDEHSSIEALYRAEKQKLDLKYQTLYAPLYEKRSGIVSGDLEPETDDEVSGVIEETPADSEREKNVEDRGIPEFWLTAFCNHGIIEQTITERDFPALRFLKDVRSIDKADMKGFKLEFYFHPNPYFENEILTKDYEVEQSIEGEAVLENTTATEIKWKEGMNLCKHSVKKKQRSKGSRAQTRTITKIEPCASFFNLFNPIDLASVEEESEEHELLLRQLDSDFQLGYVIHDRIVPEALLWYTGEAAEAEDSDFEPDEDYEDEDEDEEEEDDEDDESVNETSDKPQNTTGDKPPECKNQ